MFCIETAFRDAMAAAGLPFDGSIEPDGRLHRFKVNGDHGPNSFYVLHPDDPAAGMFGCWKRDVSETWCAKSGDTLTDEERAERDRKWKQQQAEREAERRRLNEEARAQAQVILDTATPATHDHPHPYLLRKHAKAHPGVMVGHWPQRQIENCLLIPLRTANGQLATVQAIYPNRQGERDKDFLKGGAKQGAHFVIGDLHADTILIAEGYATAATIHAATGHPAVMAVDAGNLQPVAEAIRALHPSARVILCADNDRATEGNPGLTKATAAAKAIRAALAVPTFAEGEAGSDFNDLALLRGLDAVRDVIVKAFDSGTTRNDTAIADEDLFSDYGNVTKLLTRLSGRLAYTPGLGWLLYNQDTGTWEPEPGNERITRLVLETLREAWGLVLSAAEQGEAGLKKQLKELDGDDPRTAMVTKRVKLAWAYREKVLAWVRQCETAYRLRSTLEIAEGYFWTPPTVWDADPHILVCNNGVLDLASGRLLPHSHTYRATKSTGTDFATDAKHPAWDAVVGLLKAEGDRYTFIQQYCGSGLHGANPNELVVIFQGDGGTGKGTLLTGIHRSLGAYAETVEVGSLLATDWRRQNKSAPREDLLKLRGARFVYPSIEPPKDSKLDDGSIKALTGNDAITARYPHSKNSITFSPVFKLVIQTNFPLQTEFDDPGMKRRVIVVPFNMKPERPDPAIKNALMHDPAARAACLAWLYDGYQVWRENGFLLPESDLAVKATAAYWADMNPYEQFASDAGLRFGARLKCLKPKMTSTFKAWREETGRRDATIKGFPKWLKSRGCYDAQASTYERYWHGVEISEEENHPQLQQPQQPPVLGNKVVESQILNSTTEFTKTNGGGGCCSCADDPPRSDANNAPMATNDGACRAKARELAGQGVPASEIDPQVRAALADSNVMVF